MPKHSSSKAALGALFARSLSFNEPILKNHGDAHVQNCAMT